MERFLKSILKTTLLAAAVVIAPLAVSAPAAAYSNVSVGFNVGDVDLAYRDGWYDHHHGWHRWHNDDEWRWYRHRGYHYSDWNHDRDDWHHHHHDWDHHY
jgi:hypothetical protein